MLRMILAKCTLTFASPLLAVLPSTSFAQDDGESVFVDGVADATLRSQLAAFLTALGLAPPVGKGGPEKAPRGFRCSRGGGGVLQAVAALMDERDLAERPPLDRVAAFDMATKASKEECKCIKSEVFRPPSFSGLRDRVVAICWAAGVRVCCCQTAACMITGLGTGR